MRLHIVAIGRARAGPETTLFEHYKGRVTLWSITLAEQELRKRAAPDKLAAAEADLLLQAIPDGAYVVALDERGKERSSRGFAKLLSDLQDDGRRDVAFVIGGANGLAPPMRERADKVLSLGQATWPHMLVRGLLTEQIYRAQQIIAGHPYHRD